MNNIFSLLLGNSGLIDLLKDVFKGNKQKERDFLLKLSEVVERENMNQIELNKIEASNTNVFVSGWRPFIGWCCGFALAYNFILQPFLMVVLTAFNVSIVAPELDITQLVSILLSMLGMSAMRSYDKKEILKQKI